MRSADDLARFIADRLDEHEQMARTASLGSQWSAVKGGGNGVARVRTETDGLVATTFLDRAQHIARHDPAHVLAFVAAGRAILELHRPWDPMWPDECATCDQNSTPWVRTRASWPCPTLRAFGAIWAGHPAWREEWRA